MYPLAAIHESAHFGSTCSSCYQRQVVPLVGAPDDGRHKQHWKLNSVNLIILHEFGECPKEWRPRGHPFEWTLKEECDCGLNCSLPSECACLEEASTFSLETIFELLFAFAPLRQIHQLDMRECACACVLLTTADANKTARCKKKCQTSLKRHEREEQKSRAFPSLLPFFLPFARSLSRKIKSKRANEADLRQLFLHFTSSIPSPIRIAKMQISYFRACVCVCASVTRQLLSGLLHFILLLHLARP